VHACRLYSVDGDYLGVAHLPYPVKVGDLVSLEHGPLLRIVALVELEPCGKSICLPRFDADSTCLKS
jgi:hypothetical protein